MDTIHKLKNKLIMLLKYNLYVLFYKKLIQSFYKFCNVDLDGTFTSLAGRNRPMGRTLPTPNLMDT